MISNIEYSTIMLFSTNFVWKLPYNCGFTTLWFFIKKNYGSATFAILLLLKIEVPDYGAKSVWYNIALILSA